FSTLGPRRHGRRRWRERLFYDAQHLFAAPFLHGDEPPELEPGELDEAGAANRPKAEVGEEVRREDRLGHLEALVLRRALAVPIRERLERLCASVACVADRREEERLHHPGARLLDEVSARDEYRVIRGWSRGQLRRAWEELGGSVLHRPEHASVGVVVD